MQTLSHMFIYNIQLGTYDGIELEEMSSHVLRFPVKSYAYKIRKCLDIPIFQESKICKTISLLPGHSYLMYVVPTFIAIRSVSLLNVAKWKKETKSRIIQHTT